MASVLGFNAYGPNQRYPINGVYGTAAEHAARTKKTREQAPYDAGAPSAGAASTAARNVNPNLDFNIGPTGATSLTNQSAQERALVELKARLESDAAKTARSNLLSDRNSFLGVLQQPAVAQPRVTRSGGMANEAGARAAAFSRAKDQAGRIARSSLTAIAEQMAGRGVSGGGMQALQDAGAIGTAAGSLQDLVRDQMMMDVARAQDTSDMDYHGQITQRGQDLANRQSYLSLLSGLY